MRADERAFEASVEGWLLSGGGYVRGDPDSFDAGLGLDPAVLIGFLEATQARSLEALVTRYGGDRVSAEAGLLKRVAGEIDGRGTLDVLRHGVVDLGVSFRLVFFRPAHGLTRELLARYEANRLGVVRQLPYEAGEGKTLDLCLLVNGVPVATAELKNPLTGQDVEDAKKQYRTDRDPGNVLLGRRALVHFAVDPEQVAITTRLEKGDTRFLPFNLGDAGAAGNPANPGGHRTSYLWERVWRRDAWLDLLARFLHVEMPDGGSKAQRRRGAWVIFPRFHQWEAVVGLEADARERGAGQHYLIQHSAGSGKSNTIAWLAHRLSSLHTASDEKVFDKVVVITDRVVLDRQLQDTIYQFEHVHGVVERIDTDSAQLAGALAGEQARIIITTLQKFPFVLDKVEELPSRRYAVIVDEAHSSQTGEAAKDLKAVLGEATPGEDLLAKAEVEDLAEVEARGDGQDFLARSAAARGRQPNLSFFAFTATPKAKTLELFGTPNPVTGNCEPFHLYTMRQAIEEGFILDVLASYTTYDTYYRIEKAITDDPEYEKPRAQAAIARFVTLHPHNLAQRAEVIVEHFRNHTAHRIAGKAKAMVVTSSRLHAVRYKQALDRYIRDKGYKDVHTLVAFSGTVIDQGEEFTEPRMNRFPESQTPKQFGDGDYQVLVVAEKFQTGYDQPLLHTMYVDKPLKGLHAVQTMSRLNRIHPEKTDTFVLDFRNEVEDIQKAFQPYYGHTAAVPTDPNLLYDTRQDLDKFDVLREEEIEPAVRLITNLASGRDHPRLYALLDPALDRFKKLPEEEQDEFRGALQRFLNAYRFLAQIVSFTDTRLERDYLYCRALQSLLPGTGTGRLDLGKDVQLTHLRLEQTWQGSATPQHTDGEVRAIFDGRGKQHDPETEKLSQIVELINERFGLNLGEADQLLFDQFEETWATDQTLAAQAKANDLTNFRLAFDRQFMNTIINRMDANDEILKRILDNHDFRNLLADYYTTKIYTRLRHNTEQHDTTPSRLA
ncbi:MAG: type I restriction endonuclease [Actinomycetia bacterium]|nr:type I restriction endonuclease [Actinomycetes bacterium]